MSACEMPLSLNGAYKGSLSTVPYGTNFQVEVTGDGEKWESTQREGDFEGEQRVARRIAELGLVECKRNLELELRRRIEDSMSQDDIVSALDVCKRRRPLSDRMQSVVDTILHVIRYRIRDRTADDDKILQSTTAKICEIKVLMGVFTSNVSHEVDFENRVVILTGHTPCSPKLTKEIRLQMPKRADVSYLVARYTAGVYEIIAPYEEGDHSIQIAQNIANIVHYNSDADNNYLGESRIEDGLYEIPVIGKSEYNTVTKADLSTTRSNNDLENVPDNVPAKSEILHYVQPASDVPNSTSSRETSHISFHHVPSERKISYVSRWSGRKPLNLVSEDEGFESTV